MQIYTDSNDKGNVAEYLRPYLKGFSKLNSNYQND